MSNSVRPQRQKPTRLPRPWDSLGKNTGVSCHFLLQCMKGTNESEVTQSCPTLSGPREQPTRLLCPWDFPGKSTGVGCHCLLHRGVSRIRKTSSGCGVWAKVLQSLIRCFGVPGCLHSVDLLVIKRWQRNSCHFNNQGPLDMPLAPLRSSGREVS